VQDVYSEAVRFVLNGRSKLLSKFVGAYYERMELKLLAQSDSVVCICEEFSDLVAGWGVPRSKICVIENWAPLDEVVPTPKLNAWATEHGVHSRFCFMYSGTLGLKHRPELLLALAEWLQGRPDTTLVVIAAGAGADWLKNNSAHLLPGTLELLPFQPYERLSEVLGSADVLISLLNSEASSFAVPSKTLSYLCAGRPLIIAAPQTNRATQVVQLASAGLAISPEDPTELIAAAERLLADAVLRFTYGANARTYAEETFNIDRIADRFGTVFSARHKT
jgi:glycosyltransferase involved in cell wall biosynthesis